MNTTTAAHFRSLHRRADALVLPNAWDPASAVLFAQAGAAAIATSSAAVAWALGYRDGEQLPPAELIASIGRIRRVVNRPLSIDIEAGFHDDETAVANVAGQVQRAGAVGINIEDGIQPSERLAAKIHAIRAQSPLDALFINARTDVYLSGLASGRDAIEMVIARAEQYAAAGADGLFVPCLTDLAAIAEIAERVALPLNVMLAPALPSVAALNEAGVARISAGPSLFLKAYSAAAQAAVALTSGQSAGLFEGTLRGDHIEALLAP
jgi:2-methylisocitrate lyase-like PEP mutase family enzyme